MVVDAVTEPNITELAVETVDKIGDSAAVKLEAAADAHEAKAKADADKMREMAAAIRDQCKTAAEHLAAFCQRSNDVMDTMGQLSARIASQKVIPRVSEPATVFDGEVGATLHTVDIGSSNA